MADEYGVIWDVDGTLVDTAELHFQAWCVMARQIGKPFTRADFADTFGWRNPEIIPKLFGETYSQKEIDDLGERKEALYRDQAKKGVALLPGVRSLLRGLADGGFRQAIGSSAPRENLQLLLAMNKLEHYFSAVVSMEDTNRGKPDPEVFLLAAQKLGVAPRHCLVFEDAPVGIQAAKAAGMRAVGVGFVGHHPEESLVTAGADQVVHSLESLSVSDVQGLLQM